jgi:hypothetical protein
VAIVRVMSSTRAPREVPNQATLQRLIELLARIEVERYLVELRDASAVRNDAECEGSDIRTVQR